MLSQASVSRDVLSPTPPGPEGSNGNGLLRVQRVPGAWLIFSTALVPILSRYQSLHLFVQETIPRASNLSRQPPMQLAASKPSPPRSEMKSQPVPPKFASAHITILVAGKLFDGHLSYLDQLIQSAHECRLWPLLNLARLEEVDRAALQYLSRGENREFEIAFCPPEVRARMEGARAAAA